MNEWPIDIPFCNRVCPDGETSCTNCENNKLYQCSEGYDCICMIFPAEPPEYRCVRGLALEPRTKSGCNITGGCD